MKIVFRVDASNQIGTGHFMRCLTLAEGLYKHGASIKFVSRHIPPYFVDMLKTKGCQFLQLPNIEGAKVDSDLQHADWLGVSQFEDAVATKNALSPEKCDWLIVDHYALDSRWEKELRPVTKKIMVIDDIADREHDCDLLLDQNYYQDMQSRYKGKVPDYCKFMLGPSYALLKDEFLELRSKTKPRDGRVKQVLVFFGGVDQDNYTSKAIQALSGIEGVAFDVDVVIGIQHPAKYEIENDCKRYGYTCHIQTIEMAKFIANADLGIGAAGSATWERCALGLPTITIPIAGNQSELNHNAAKAGVVYYPEIKGNFISSLTRHITAMIENPILINLISQSAYQLVDAIGVARVVSKIFSKQLKVRLVTEADMSTIFEWRNHPDIRKFSINNELIKWNKHQDWFKNVLADKNKVLLIGHDGSSRIGVVRLDFNNKDAEISIYLAPELLSKGLGTALLQAAESWLLKNFSDVSRIKAEVLSCNLQSQNFFMNNGYSNESNIYTKRLTH